MSIADLRREYGLGGLRRSDLDSDPIAQFKQWFGQATGTRGGGGLRKAAISVYKGFQALFGSPPPDANAMTLATVDKEGRPSARTVLLKGVDERGFIFFTNYGSRKGQELTDNPQAALCFYWADLERQVCVRGEVTKLPTEESEAYFRSRPRGSRIAAWASNQSAVLPDREALETQFRETEKKFPGEDVPLPPNWGGYVLSATYIEFWQGRPNRMHDRFCYTREADGRWRLERLSP
jgi:pyridoxamine 5'-phosphate oxidase